MRIIHTSDWHLGKYLEGASRLEEQKQFLEDFVVTVKENDIDLVIIAGDVYDTSNPPAEAERLFYKGVKALSEDGKRVVLVIAGNHDHPERLEASNPIAIDDGIIILSKPKSIAPTGHCGKHQIIDSGEGYIELEINNEKIILLTMSYPSEKRLNEMIYTSLEDEKDMQMEYSKRLGEIFGELQEKFRKDTINIAVSHLFTLGGEESTSERSIQLGGSYSVNVSDLPLNAQYIALGHLHKPQRIKNSEDTPVIYSGSPLQYSKSERSYAKCCYLIEAEPSKPVEIEKLDIKNYKPIEVWRCKSIEEALEKCEENNERDLWVYLEIETDEYIANEEIRQLKKLKKDIVEIKPILKDDQVEIQYFDVKEQPIQDLFKEFYTKERGNEPSDELIELFLGIVEEGESHAAN
ncbi:exonuclease SbcCD subunit D [Vallitalea okinawensis]|uniref:exonuclease SbcCD subunit D n=1 Tax=Vallitalea okinawensis TaxID=2078660 RepID=UPI000CFD4746|nr:exonuclease SbcCD subunit D [Vallitalea okinawensis]